MSLEWSLLVPTITLLTMAEENGEKRKLRAESLIMITGIGPFEQANIDQMRRTWTPP